MTSLRTYRPILRHLGRYMFALGMVAAGDLLCWSLPQVLSPRPFLAFWPVVVVAAEFGGMGPGLLATVASALCVDIIFHPPYGGLSLHDWVGMSVLTIFLAGGSAISVFIGVKRKLQSRQRLQAAAMQSAANGIALTDAKGIIFWVNPAFCAMTGYAPGEILGKPHWLHDGGEQKEAFCRNLWSTVRPGETSHRELVRRRKDGTIYVEEQSVTPLTDADGRIIHYVLIMQDITKRKRAEEALKTSEERLRLALEAAKAGTWAWDLRTNANFWSEELFKVYGLEPHSCEPSYETWRQTIHPEDREHAEHAVQEASKKGTELQLEWRVQDPDGGERWLMSRGRPLCDADGQPISYMGVAIDITERKRSEIELHNSHQEKVALLKEVHHRVKNNLQIVVSLLGLQAGRTVNPEALEVLEDTRNRVRSMALLHEVLYRSGNLARISFATYLGDLCRQIVASFGQPAQRINVEQRVGDIGLPLDQAVPCGLIVNELVTNAFKHAFPNEPSGRVVVEFDRIDGQELLLSVHDDGVGLPREIESKTPSTLGLLLVFELSRQLIGRLTVDRPDGGGTVFRVIFPASMDNLERG